MGRLQKLWLGLLIFLASVAPAHAQEPIQATADAALDEAMPRVLRFTLDASSSAGEIVEARVLFQPVGSSARSNEPVALEAAPSVRLEHEWEMQRNFVPPGAEIEYFWKLTDSVGNSLDTPRQRVVALDPRFEWQTVEDERLAIHWYDGNQAWGEEMLQTGQEALDTLQAELGTSLERKVRLVAYRSGDDFRGAFPTQQDWIGGQAFPDLAVTVQIIGAGDRDWMRTVLFHELSHLVFQQAMDGSLASAPAWLEEGLAMYNEPDLLGGSRDSATQVQRAAEQDRLLPFSQLQGNFGADGAVVGLAYAQSEMLVTHLIETCGEAGFRQVVQNLVDDQRMEEALSNACGLDDEALYAQWRQTLPNAPAPTDSAPSGEGAPATPEGRATGLPPALLALLGLGLCVVGLLGVAIAFVAMRLLRPARRSP